MPVYEYECKKCGRFEIHASITDNRDNILCPKCKNKDVFRIFSANIKTTSTGSGISKKNLSPDKILGKAKNHAKARGQKYPFGSS